MDKSYRIKANVGSDQVLNVNLSRDVDLYEILSLKLTQENMYRKHSADYGVVVGRVLANDAFGVPNAKVSIFIPISAEDGLRSDIRSIYPYESVNDYNGPKRFNTLSNYKKNDCHQPVGSFPNKRLVLDNDTVLEIFDKYYRYTSVTNKSGDYMIFGVPTGSHMLHVDVDLSDIGVLSQMPRDFVYQGYSIDMFNSPTQFKTDTNLDSLPQIMTQNDSITIYPYWGDKDTNQIAITRKDITLSYKFEPTCVFMGSVVTDNGDASVAHNCVPDENVGEVGQLVPNEGTIEMIRKTFDGRVEEFVIKGNRLIDGDGVFCYQIPMNLDYVGMDEKGNIVPTDNPNKGIPTRAKVRFRFTLNETNGASTRHKARYLVPNNPDLFEDEVTPMISEVLLKDDIYEFGSRTPESCFRDLYWNKVYSVKNYIPRVQISMFEKTSNYLAIKGVNKRNAKGKNTLPFNKMNLNFDIPSYYNIWNIGRGKSFLSGFWNYINTKYINYSLDAIRENVLEKNDSIGLDFYNDWLNGCLYFPAWYWFNKVNEEAGQVSQYCDCNDNSTTPYIYNNCSLPYSDRSLMVEDFFSEFKPRIGLYHKLNYGVRTFIGGLIKKITNKDGGELFYYTHGNKSNNEPYTKEPSWMKGGGGEIKTPTRVASGGDYEYDDNGNITVYDYVRLFATDIILLGSLVDCDLENVPKMPFNIPSTTANIPPMGVQKEDTLSDAPDEVKNEIIDNKLDEELEMKYRTVNGMHWGYLWGYKGINGNKNYGYNDASKKSKDSIYNYVLGSGLFFGIQKLQEYYAYDYLKWALVILGFGKWSDSIDDFWKGKLKNKLILRRVDFFASTDVKSCVNVERISELGVSMDAEMKIVHKPSDNDSKSYWIKSPMDGFITKRELVDNESRALFASLNHNKLLGSVHNRQTGYNMYNIEFLYPTDFDGRLQFIAPYYTGKLSQDYRNLDYLDFRFGSGGGNEISNFVGDEGSSLVDYMIGADGAITYTTTTVNRQRHFYTKGSAKWLYFAFPLYNNSFYFFFGLNRGSTAIDKLYKNFYSYCPVNNKFAFNLKIRTVQTSGCRNDGQITVSIGEIEKPFTIALYKGSLLRKSESNLNSNGYVFSGLEAGAYTVTVIDANGSEMTEDNIVISKKALALEYEVVRDIGTFFQGQECNKICSNNENTYGIIRFNSVTVDGKKYNIVKIELKPDENYVYFDMHGCRVIINTNNGYDENISEYLCDCEVDNVIKNEINIYKPSRFAIDIYQLCNGMITDTGGTAYNHVRYNTEIKDMGEFELYINSVPLKMLIGGGNEEVLNTDNAFYNGRTYDDIRDVRGWFDVHKPTVYDSVFKTPLDNLDIWELHTDYNRVSNNNMGIILEEKFKYMFNLCNGAYVTSEGGNYFNGVSYRNNSRLLSSSPDYNSHKSNNADDIGELTEYTTVDDIDRVIWADTASPNIISSNYVIVSDDEDNIPKRPFNDNTSKHYGFNVKYADNNTHSGNYFALFSDMSFVEKTENGCVQSEGQYSSTPYHANNLLEHMCLGDTIDYIPENVYKACGQCQNYFVNGTYPFFRTMFVDRRFDYDILFISPYDISECGYEPATWNMGRISGITYNGIEMAFDDSNDEKNLIGDDGSKYEYSYDAENGTITYNDNKKRFYSSNLKWDKNVGIDLVNAYRYDKRPDENNGLNGEYTYTEGNTFNRGQVTFLKGSRPTNVDRETELRNFGYDSYPTKRWLNFCDIPYGKEYVFENVSCSYDIDVVRTSDAIHAKAKAGEKVSFAVQMSSGVKMEGEDDNVIYEISNGDNTALNYEMVAKKFNMSFTLGYIEQSEGYKSKIKPVDSKGLDYKNGLGIRLLYDDGKEKLTKLEGIKKYNNVNIEADIERITVVSIDDINYEYTDTTAFKNKVYSFNDITLNSQGREQNKLILLYDLQYYSTSSDCLWKNLRVLNVSTIMNVSNFMVNYSFNMNNMGFGDIENASPYPKIQLNIDRMGDAYLFNTIDKDNVKMTIGAFGTNPEVTYVVDIVDNDKLSLICYLSDGAHSQENLSAFFDGGGKLDISVGIKLKNGFKYKFNLKVDKVYMYKE